jgi:hypothetical protein
LEDRAYVPLLKTKNAEVSAYRTLSIAAKDKIFPIFQVRPWPNANHLELTVDRVREAVDGHPFGLGLDVERFGGSSTKPAQREFDDLFDARRGYAAYYDFISNIPDAVPVLIPTGSADALLLQIGNADRLDRGLIIHQRRGAAIPLSDMIVRLPPLPHDTVIVIDAGWSRDYVSLEAWAAATFARVYEALPNAELVIMASSFPDSFSHIVGELEEAAMERRLFSATRQRFNRANLTYGDWGSTRPSQAGGGGRIPSRVDISLPDSWMIFRSNPDDDYGYASIAENACGHDSFARLPECWGKQLIRETDDQGNGITGPAKNTASRINSHMTIQSTAAGDLPPDERPYED